jgi:hypothetical protein
MGDVTGFLTAMSGQDGPGRVGASLGSGTPGAMFHVEQRIVPEVFLPIGEPRNRFISLLGLCSGKIDGLTHQARRSSCLQPTQTESNLNQGPGQTSGRGFAGPTTGLLIGPDVHETPQERSGGHHDRFSEELDVQSGLYPINLTFPMEQTHGLALFAVQ